MGNKLVGAARDGDLAKVRQLCADPKADVNFQDPENGVTALMEASHGGHLEIVAFLVTQGADVNLTSKLGVPAVVYAAARNRLGVVEYLVARGADPGPIQYMRRDIANDKEGVASAIKRGLELRSADPPPQVARPTGANGTRVGTAAPSTTTSLPKSPSGTTTLNGTPTGGGDDERADVAAQGKQGGGAAGAAGFKPSSLRTTTSMLKQEVDKLKEFLATDDLTRVDQLKADKAEWERKYHEKDEECRELQSKLQQVISQQLDPSQLASVMPKAPPADWEKERQTLIERNKKLEETIKNLVAQLNSPSD